MHNKHEPPPPPPQEVYDYFVKELAPLKKEAFPFWEELLRLRLTVCESVRRTKLRKCQTRYEDLARRWVDARGKVTILEKLINPEDKDAEAKLAILMTSGYLTQLQRHEAELTRIMHDISNTLRDKIAEADFKRATAISTAALIIAVISVVISVLT